MKSINTVRTIVSGFLVALPAAAHAVGPFTENFTAGTANWRQNTSAVNVNFQAAGGPDGSSHATSPFAFVNATIPQVALFRGHNNFDASGDAFVGDWLAANIVRLSAYVQHNAPQALDFFVRLATTNNSPAVSFTLPQPVPQGVWTLLDFDIGFANPLHTNEGPPTQTFYNSVLSQVGNVQIGVIVPMSLATDATVYEYGLDQVAIVPEPASILLALGCVAFGLSRRRRRR